MSEIEVSRAQLEELDLRELDQRIEELLAAVETTRAVRAARMHDYERAIRTYYGWYDERDLPMGPDLWDKW